MTSSKIDEAKNITTNEKKNGKMKVTKKKALRDDFAQMNKVQMKAFGVRVAIEKGLFKSRNTTEILKRIREQAADGQLDLVGRNISPSQISDHDTTLFTPSKLKETGENEEKTSMTSSKLDEAKNITTNEEKNGEVKVTKNKEDETSTATLREALRDDFTQMTKVQMKAYAIEKGLNRSGTKADLLKRIKEHAANNQMDLSQSEISLPQIPDKDRAFSNPSKLGEREKNDEGKKSITSKEHDEVKERARNEERSGSKTKIMKKKDEKAMDRQDEEIVRDDFTGDSGTNAELLKMTRKQDTDGQLDSSQSKNFPPQISDQDTTLSTPSKLNKTDENEETILTSSEQDEAKENMMNREKVAVKQRFRRSKTMK